LLGRAGHQDEVIDQATGKHERRRARLIAESLARATSTPIEQVAEIYLRESAELERTARVKSFIGVIAARRTRGILSNRTP
jgi:hypothetical protein